MKILTFIKKIEDIDYIFSLDKKFDGACPCFDWSYTVDGFKVTASGHCWRTTVNGIIGGCKCPHSGVHLWSDMPKKDFKLIGKALGKRLDEADWYGHWEVVYEHTRE